MNFSSSFVFVALIVALIVPIESSTWTTFQISHILDPDTTEATNYFNWNKEEWVTFLNARDELDKIERGSKRNPNPLNKKGINSFILSSPENVKDAFSSREIVLFKSKPNGNLYWSNDNFLIYTLKRLNNGGYEVYRCVRFYFVAALNASREPVHFDACGLMVLADYRGNLQFPWNDCVRIQ